VREHVVHPGTWFGKRGRPLSDRVIQVHRALFDTLHQERGGKGGREIGNGIRRVGTGKNPTVNVLEAESPFPDNPAILHDGRGKTRNSGLLSERLQIALELQEPQVLALRASPCGQGREPKHEHDESDCTHSGSRPQAVPES
jgi:hypothetical protein